MKTWKNLIACKLFLFLVFMLTQPEATAQSSGRVVINEYMPWTSNGCGATAEFIELMNFGPGPMDISCYILTDGDYSITIPPNTILKAGEFYVISGQNTIPVPCANIDSTIGVNLNWNTCGCTSAPIPTTGDGFLTDGGSGSEQLVLMDPNLTLVDAVVRSYPLESSSLITTSNIGGCVPKTFDLDLMTINYEVLGMSAGRGNSFARNLDGDCGWVKDPQQSAHATNNTGSDISDIAYDFSIVDAMDCNDIKGSVEVFVKHSDYASVFPMNYTIVKDVNNDGLFDFSDSYTYGYDDSPPSIYIDGFGIGRYRLTVASVKGCYLETFDFTILPCHALLPVKLFSFKLDKAVDNARLFRFVLGDVENIKQIILEKSTGDDRFISDKVLRVPTNSVGTKEYSIATDITAAYRFYRLKIVSKNGSVIYSSTINTSVSVTFASDHLWPSPASDKINVLLSSSLQQKALYTITGLSHTVKTGTIELLPGHNNFSIPVSSLPRGLYQITFIPQTKASQPITFRFVKQ